MVNVKRHLLETATLVLASVLCAFVANAFAANQRKIPLSEPALPTRPAGGGAVQPAPASGGDTGTLVETGKGVETGKLADTGRIATVTPPAPAPRTSTAPEASKTSKAATPAEILSRFAPHPDKPYREITGDDAQWLHTQGALVLDARRTSIYAEGHIAGARPFSVWEGDLGDKLLSLANEGRNGDMPVVVYCAGGECEDSHMLSERLFALGFTNVLVYKDGWPDWQKRRGPSQTGTAP